MVLQDCLDFFQQNPATQARGHAFKLYKRNCTHRSRAVFSQSVLLTFGTSCLIQLILDHYHCSCVRLLYGLILLFTYMSLVLLHFTGLLSAINALLSSHMTNKDDDDVM